MHIPGLGTLTKDDDLGGYVSDDVTIKAFGGQACQIGLEGYDDDHDKSAFHEAIENFLSVDSEVLAAAAPYVFQYYEDMRRYLSPDDQANLNIAGPADVWSHVQFGYEAIVSRRSHGDRAVYVSVECNCDWEPEHGLQIVLKEGRTITKIGPYDGHLTNVDAYGKDLDEGTIYVRIGG